LTLTNYLWRFLVTGWQDTPAVAIAINGTGWIGNESYDLTDPETAQRSSATQINAAIGR